MVGGERRMYRGCCTECLAFFLAFFLPLTTEKDARHLIHGTMLVGTMGDATVTNANTRRMIDMWNQVQNPTMQIEQRISLLDEIMKSTNHYGFPDRQSGDRILEMRFGLSEFIKSPTSGQPIDKNPVSFKAFL